MFVGADLKRKGGPLLLEAFRAVRPLGVELHVVTPGPVPAEPGLFVYTHMEPNSPALSELYHESDMFCLPTYADCLPIVLAEAGAAGLPLVATDVAGIREIVEDGAGGFLVPVGDARALVAALGALVRNADLRLEQGARAAAVVTRKFDAQRNARQVLDLLKQACAPERGPATPDGGLMADVLLTVSGVVAPRPRSRSLAASRPRADYQSWPVPSTPT